jgi:hypothetical protein
MPFPQIFVGFANTEPVLPGVVVKVVPSPNHGVQSIGAVQVKFVAFAAETVKVKGIPGLPV